MSLSNAQVSVTLDGDASHTGDTSYLAVVDKDRNVVSFEPSLHSGWGTGVVMGDLGFIFTCRGDYYSLVRGEANALEYDWRYRARPEQLPPAGSWRVWLLLAGRGFGKTRCGAEWVRAQVKAGRRRIALVGPTAADARNVMVEGESGILAISPDPERPLYEPSKRRLTWPNGAVATTYSADEPERLRGPQHDAAWCDELGAWRYPEAWDMLMFGMRLGEDPRAVVTTTPKPTKIIRELVADPTTVVTRGSICARKAGARL